MTPADSVAQMPAVGVDMGGTKILAAVVDARGKIRARVKMPTQAEDGADAVVKRVAKSVLAVIEESRLTLNDIGAMGISIPCPVDPAVGFVENAVNLGWLNFPAKKKLEKAIGRPIWLENDVNAGTYGEFRYGAAQGRQDVFGIFAGTGIGGGVIIGGRMHRGFNKTSGEVGHIIMKVDGPVQGGGFPGTFEALASRTALTKWLTKQIEKKGRKSALKKAMKDEKKKGAKGVRIRSGMIKDAAEAGDKVVLEGLERTARILGMAASSIIHVLGPEMVVMGGGLMEACGPFLMPTIKKTVEQFTFEIERRNVDVVMAQLGDDAGILGAAAIARDEMALSTAKPAK
ncbi:MAG TPA: ROK family protein [Planctomycetota bacterium]|nr:ROK family protein [Planctomycetota bacterium]